MEEHETVRDPAKKESSAEKNAETAVIDASIYFSKCSSRVSTRFRGHELHFVQVRVKGGCQTKTPKLETQVNCG